MELQVLERKSLFQLPKDYFQKLGEIQLLDANYEVIITEKKIEKIENHVADPNRDIAPICRRCTLTFTTTSEQHQHFKTPWHRFNLKLEMAGLEFVDEEEFQRLQAAGELSSSDSEGESNEKADSSSSEEDEEEVAPAQLKTPRIMFQTLDGRIFALWRNLFAAPPKESVDYLSLLPLIPSKRQWTFFMCMGGHFAGAIFTEDRCTHHKTFHRYTVRKKQGGSQGSKDNQTGGRIKSAGSSIRRYNETRLREDIAAVLSEWKSNIDSSSLIFLFAPSFNAKSFYFENSPLRRSDPRIQSIPFPTYRPSLVEITRCHKALSTVEFLSITRTKSDEISEEIRAATMECAPQLQVEIQVEEAQEDLLLKAIQSKNLEQVKNLLSSDWELPIPKTSADLISHIGIACQMNLDAIATLLITSDRVSLDAANPSDRFNTPLHIVSRDGKTQLLKILLEKGANPTIKNIDEKTPYDVSKDKKVRHIMSTFRRDFPEKWEYDASHIPMAISEEEQKQKEEKEKEKKKKKKKAQAEKVKQKKIEEIEEKKIQEKVEEEKKIVQEQKAREAKMTDREKRALAAERRLGMGSGKTCAMCQGGLPLVPFERSDFQYCSMKCLAAHRDVVK
eukprot:TRINITY_DN3958_c1_g1_i1.p1 TRINITY_DN3958_c1_g1~~TRINITY_DN3958_c1_g1_i1.p1  ORF type:complete len:618 (+),score=224.98 TRINITY_DN3958_c1_g1_i1:21-1874(+)